MWLLVPPQPLVVPVGVFDAWSWCESDRIELSVDGALVRRRITDSTNPSDLLFLMHAECTYLPREIARLHARGFQDQWALAPYAIDDATDGFFAHRQRPREILSLHAPSLPALVWGLHDWAHFHNHGPFDDAPMTELQCDLVALAWLQGNAETLGLGAEEVAEVRADLAALAESRFKGRDPPWELLRLFTSSSAR